MDEKEESGEKDTVLIIAYILHLRTSGLDLSMIQVPVWRCCFFSA
jgi:hypothetical protein